MTPTLRQLEGGEEAVKLTPPDAVPVPGIVTYRQTREAPALPAWLKAKTGEGSVADYLEHPGNPNSSPAVARVLRGLTGILGSLDYAVVDVGLGLLAFLRERAVNSGPADVAGGARA